MGRFRSGYVSLTGKPNVGKSTLLNTILGEKVAIVTSKPQTTRNRITGIKTLIDAQIIFMDTPGIHKPMHKLGKIMVKTAKNVVREVDLILFMVEPEELQASDEYIIELLKGLEKPVFLLINKVDVVKKPLLLPIIDTYSKLYLFKEIIPISALTGEGVDDLLKSIVGYLLEGPKYYPDDIITDQIERFMVSEIIREKIIAETEEEVPYSVAVEVIEWEEVLTKAGEEMVSIRANIYVERDSQKGIIIGAGGGRLKTIGTSARIDIERLLGTKVFLELWVKTKRDWRYDERVLRELGFK